MVQLPHPRLPLVFQGRVEHDDREKTDGSTDKEKINSEISDFRARGHRGTPAGVPAALAAAPAPQVHGYEPRHPPTRRP